MRRHTLIEHKETTIVCEESGPISFSYNILLTTQETNVVVKPIVLIITAKSTLTYTNCGKIGLRIHRILRINFFCPQKSSNL